MEREGPVKLLRREALAAGVESESVLTEQPGVDGGFACPQGCDMIASGRITSTGIVCNCHGSMFDKDGNPVSGPARSALEQFQVTVDTSGNITVHGGTTVAQSTRTPVG